MVLGPLSTLLIDDNPIFLRILARFLSEHAGGAVKIVGSVVGGADAVAQARRLQPAAVILDLAMPDVSGMELLPRLRAILPEAILIVLTLMDLRDCREAALSAGANEVISKLSLDRDLVPAFERLASNVPQAVAAQPLTCEGGACGTGPE